MIEDQRGHAHFRDNPDDVDHEGPRVVRVHGTSYTYHGPTPMTYRSGLNWRELERKRKREGLWLAGIWLGAAAIVAGIVALLWLVGR